MMRVKFMAALLAGVLATTASLAAEYPTGPIRMIVPFPAGGPVDVVGRIVSKRLGDVLGQNIIVDNRVGAAGGIGTQMAMSATPDGYTLFIGSTATISILPAVNPKVRYNPDRDFVAIGVAATGVHVLAVNGKSPASNLAEFRKMAETQKTPITVATGDGASPPDLGTLAFEQQTGIKFQRIPYKGTGPGLADVAAGHTQFIFVDTSSAMSLLQSGDIKAIGIASLERSSLLPNVPTMDEQGLKGFESGGWFGVFAPVGVPKDVYNRVATALAQVLKDPETQASFTKLGLTHLQLTGEAAIERVKKENEKWGKLVAASGTRASD